MKNIYTIIVTYNAMRRGWIDRCLSSLRESTIPTIPIVVDNCSSDGTREYVPQHYPEVVWLPQDKNMGFGQGNNVGIRYAMTHEASHVLLLNQDAALHAEAIEHMLKADDGMSLLSPLHLNGTGTAFDYNFRKDSFPSDGNITEDIFVRGDMQTAYETGEICAACWLLPIGVIEKIGGFNPVFFQYCEDNNYYDRLFYHGIRTLLVPRAKMYHDRECHGDTQAYNNQLLRRRLTLAVYDINNTTVDCIKMCCGLLISCYRNDLPHGKYIPGKFVCEAIRLMADMRNIRASRKKEKTINPNWL